MEFQATLAVATRHKTESGRYMLTTTLRSGNGRTWSGSERVLVR